MPNEIPMLKCQNSEKSSALMLGQGMLTSLHLAFDIDLDFELWNLTFLRDDLVATHVKATGKNTLVMTMN
jgi:hypothetical protein